ncbi:MAG: preprotein translocase subunit SecA [Clostridiales bacterium]|nr:preprotein translocase subunit SecA [Clostridiales bacterium]
MSIIKSIFGTHSEKELRRIDPIADKVMALEESFKDIDLQAKTDEFKKRYADGETLDSLLPEAFAAVREAARRELGMMHYREQVIGGIVLHQGRIAEMKTGEGKTLTATLPVYLNALTGKGVHVVTVNDYLAKRDSEWMGKVYKKLGLTVGLIIHDIPNKQRKDMYSRDVVYGTNNEFGFDYLRDNMVVKKENIAQRELNYAIVDEVDSILIDEARTPLIISGRGTESSELYGKADQFVRTLKPFTVVETDDKIDMDDLVGDADYVIDEKANTSVLTSNGTKKAEKFFGIENLSDPENFSLQHYINNALKAHGNFHLDQQYVVQDGEVIIVDDFTGRLMPGRRYSDGLHQSIEAKEGVKVANENRTLATITFQNYFRMYNKLSGMTGTAATEEDEFRSIYNLDVIQIPTHRTVIRVDENDAVFKTQKGKYAAVLKTVIEAHQKGQPVLVGTVNVDKSEYLSKIFTKAGIKHNVLNAKNHTREAEIVAQAGRLNMVTIATNMAGRGTDILLGGNAEFYAKQEMRKQGYSEDDIEAATTHIDNAGDFDISDDKIKDNIDPVLSGKLSNLSDRFFNGTVSEIEKAIAEVRNVLNEGETEERYNEITLKKAGDLLNRAKYAALVKKFDDQLAPEAEKVREAGGLFIVGTERHESRRIDNQLKGRSGRQGDPGRSKFFLALDDDLLRIFGGDRVTNMYNTLGVDETMEIQSRMLTKIIDSSQKKLEAMHFGMRKNVLEYDDVMNIQRTVIYDQRRKVIDGVDMHDTFLKMIERVAERQVGSFATEGVITNAERYSLGMKLSEIFGDLPIVTKLLDEKAEVPDTDEIIEAVKNDAVTAIEEKQKVFAELGANLGAFETLPDFHDIERQILLSTVDSKWMDHIDAMDQLQTSIRMRSVGQHDPVVEYKMEGSQMFDEMNEAIQDDAVKFLMRGNFTPEKRVEAKAAATSIQEGPARKAPVPVPQAQSMAPDRGPTIEPVKRDSNKVGRNDLCPCGSGKKYKNCCGKNEK